LADDVVLYRTVFAVSDDCLRGDRGIGLMLINQLHQFMRFIDPAGRLVDEHVRAENAHELDRTMATLNETPLFKLNDKEVVGHDGVRAFYADLFQGFPGLHIDVTQRHVSDEAVILEVMISGTHTNEFRGIPATGRHSSILVVLFSV
jgi:steroid delta-isomerase-like uncharacterized protein